MLNKPRPNARLSCYYSVLPVFEADNVYGYYQYHIPKHFYGAMFINKSSL